MVGWQEDYLETFEHLTPFFGSGSPDSQQIFSPEALPRKSPSAKLAAFHCGRLSRVTVLGAEVG